MQLPSFSFILFQAPLALETSPTQQSPAPPLQANSALPVAEGIGSASIHCPPASPLEHSQASPLGDSACGDAFQTPRASSTARSNISPGAGSENTEMLPGSCAMSEVMPASSATMSDIAGSARMSVDGGGISDDGDGPAPFPGPPDFPWKQSTVSLGLPRTELRGMLVNSGVHTVRSAFLALRPESGDTEDPNPSPSPSPSPTGVVTPVTARTVHESQDSGVSVFYVATIGSKCIHVGNTLHLEKFSLHHIKADGFLMFC